MSGKYLKKKKFHEVKSLPTRILSGQDKTCVVRLKRIGGEVYQDCDVYIGPKMQNASWSFQESPWVNFFHYATNDRRKNLELYENYVRNSPALCSKLYSLRGKRLGCFCENKDFCHGSILVKLVEELAVENTKKINDIIFFKGESCPLSNIWQCNFMSRNFTIYNSSEQYRLSLIARRLNDPALLTEIMQCSTSKEICQLSKVVTKRAQALLPQVDDQIKDMTKSIQLKMKRCPPFEEYCSEKILPGTLLLEGTKNTFWACGKDFDEISDQDTATSFEGLNLVGWIILFAVASRKKWGRVLQNISSLDTITTSSTHGLQQVKLDDNLLREVKAVSNTFQEPLEMLNFFSNKKSGATDTIHSPSLTQHDPDQLTTVNNSSPGMNHGVEYLKSLKSRFPSECPLFKGLEMVIDVLSRFQHEFV